MKQCTVDGCEKNLLARGFCKTHYQRLMKTGDPGPAELLRLHLQPGTPCSVEGCATDTYRRGMCQLHYQRVQKFGDTGTVLQGADVSLIPRDQATCPECGVSLAGKRRNAVYCSRACKARHTERDRRREKRPVRIAAARSFSGVSVKRINYPPECDGMTPDQLRKWRYDNTADGDRRRARSRAYYDAHQEQQALYTRNYKHTERDSGPDSITISLKEWNRLKARHHYECAYCNTPAAVAPLRMDHVVPLSRGGRHVPANILPACDSCNISKRRYFLTEWRLLLARGGKPHPYGYQGVQPGHLVSDLHRTDLAHNR